MTAGRARKQADAHSLRILMVTPTSFFNDYGGHIRILEETRALTDLGHDVSIITYFMGNNVPGLDIRRTPSLPWRVNYEVGSSRHKIAFDIALVGTCVRQALKIKPDIIHGHMHEGALIGGLLAKMLRIPLVMDFQGSLTGEMVDHGFLNPNGHFYRLTKSLEKIICHLPQSILTSSFEARELLIKEFSIEPSRIHPLPDCVDAVKFDPNRFSQAERDALRQELGIPNKHPVVVYLGLLAEYQGTSHLIRTAAMVKKAGHDIHFLIMGYPDVEGYRQLADSLEVADRVTFTGRVPYEDAPRYLSVGNLAVSAKMSLTEGSGKVLNYMAMGMPTVVYDSPVHREYLSDLGVYVPSGDVESLSQTIVDVIKDPQKGEVIGEGLRNRAKSVYSWERASNQIDKIYRSHLSR